MKIKHLGQICVGPTLSQVETERIKNLMKQRTDIDQRVKLHGLLAGETRFKLIKILSELRELCVCDMAEILDMSVSAVSHQLSVLRRAGLVTTRREAQTIYYSLEGSQITRIL